MKNITLTILVIPLLAGCMVVPHRTTVRESVTGSVLDGASGLPVHGARITYAIPHTTFRAQSVSETNGNFTVGPLRQWHWLVYIGSPGHYPDPAYWDCALRNATVVAVKEGYATSVETLESALVFTNGSVRMRSTRPSNTEPIEIQIEKVRTKH